MLDNLVTSRMLHTTLVLTAVYRVGQNYKLLKR